jgi:hypothetical protein
MRDEHEQQFRWPATRLKTTKSALMSPAMIPEMLDGECYGPHTYPSSSGEGKVASAVRCVNVLAQQYVWICCHGRNVIMGKELGVGYVDLSYFRAERDW